MAGGGGGGGDWGWGRGEAHGTYIHACSHFYLIGWVTQRGPSEFQFPDLERLR